MIQNYTKIRTENSRYTLLRNNRLWYLYFLLCHSKVSSLFFCFCLFLFVSLRKDPQCRFIRQYWYIHLQNMCCGMGHHNELKSYLKKHFCFNSLVFSRDNPIHTALAWKIKLWPFDQDDSTSDHYCDSSLYSFQHKAVVMPLKLNYCS